MSGLEAPETGAGSRHGGSGTWWTGCMKFFRRLSHHPRHSAGTGPVSAGEMAAGGE